MKKSYSLSALVLPALLLTPLLAVFGAIDPFQSSSGQRMSSGHGYERRPAQMPNGEDPSQVLLKEQHRLSASEKALYSDTLRLIRSGEQLVEQGRDMQSIRDHRSGLDGKIVSNARARQTGAEKAAEGRHLIREGENRLVTLASQVVERIENAENKMKSGEFRTWTDKSGRELRAMFLRLDNDSVAVIREDGLEFDIPLTSLSEKDISFSVLASRGLGLDGEGFLKAIESSEKENIGHFFTAGYQPSLSTQKLALEAIIREQSSSTLQTILSNGIDPNLLLDSGKSPLSHAVELSNLELINTLLKFEASLIKKDTHGLIPVYYALIDPDPRVIERVVPEKADHRPSLHRVIEHVVKGSLKSVSIKHLNLLAKYEVGASLGSDQIATVELILAGQAPTVAGYLKALSEENRDKFLRLYRDAGLAAEAHATEWAQVLGIVKQSPGLPLDELLSDGGLSKEKTIQLTLLKSGYEVDAASYEKAVVAADRKAVELFLQTDLSPAEKSPTGESPLFQAFASQQAELAGYMIAEAEVPGHEVARIRLLAQGDSLDVPLRSKLELEADQIAFDLDTFETAVKNGNRELVDLFIAADAFDEFELDGNSPFWARTWSHTRGELRKHLLNSAFADLKLKTHVAIANVDISTWEKHSAAAKDRPTTETVKDIRKLAERGDAEAQYNVGDMYGIGDGVDQNNIEAVRWYRKAAQQGHLTAQYNMGISYANGNGVAKDEIEAVKWFRKAAEQGLAKAQFNLGILYANGVGVAKNEIEAVKWWRKAAERGLAEAQFNLGVRYANGTGVGKDEIEGAKWYRKASEQGYAAAQLNLGIMYFQGKGVPEDYAMGYMWASLAASQGDEDAKKLKGMYIRKMTREQIAEAQKLARGWLDKHSQ